MHTAKPADLGKKSDPGKRKGAFGSGVTARITGIRHQYVAPQLPGQLAGSSVLFDLVITNGSKQSIDLSTATVTVIDSAGDAAAEITSKPATRLPDQLQSDATARATYVFVVPEKHRNPVDINVTINAQLDVVVFHGDAS